MCTSLDILLPCNFWLVVILFHHGRMMQLLAICAAFPFELDSYGADYLGMKSSVLGETTDSIECGSVPPQFILYTSSLSSVLCSGLPSTVRLSLGPKLLQKCVGLSEQREENLKPSNRSTLPTGRTKLLQRHKDRIAKLCRITLGITALQMWNEGWWEALPREHLSSSRLLHEDRWG